MKSILFITSLFLLNSCANYVARMHREFDRQEGRRAPYKKKKTSLSLYKNQARPVTTESARMLSPSVQRSYGNQVTSNGPARGLANVSALGVEKPRIKARDFEDKDNASGSLWVNRGPNDNQSNHLFITDSKKRSGDILLINVNSALKNEITSELKRAFPERKTASKDAKKDDKKSEQNSEAATGETSSVHDRISSVVIEEVNSDHLLVRGRKNLLFKNRKRLVEVQALISRKDIRNGDAINSDKILESDISVIR